MVNIVIVINVKMVCSVCVLLSCACNMANVGDSLLSLASYSSGKHHVAHVAGCCTHNSWHHGHHAQTLVMR